MSSWEIAGELARIMYDIQPISSGSGGKGNGVCRTCYGRGSDKENTEADYYLAVQTRFVRQEKPAYRTDERSCGELPEMDLWMGK